MPKPGKFDSDAFYERLLVFGQRCQRLVSKLPRTQYNREYGGQLIRSSASPGSKGLRFVEKKQESPFIIYHDFWKEKIVTLLTGN